MKITGIVKRTEYHKIDIDTNDYNIGSQAVQDIFDFYQSVKDDPMEFAEDFEDRGEKNVSVELSSIEIKDEPEL